MLIKIWNFLFGYVKIEITGFSVERFLSRAAAAGVIFWEVARNNNGKFSGCVSFGDFRRLVALAEKSGCLVASLGFHGLPRIFALLKKRLFLAIGSLVFVVGMVVLTSFIWQIDVEGTNRLDADEIIAFLEENGFAVGSPRRGIAYRDVENLLLLQFGEVAWASLSITGTRAVISIIEGIESPPAQPQAQIADVVAAKDAIIVYMAISGGQPQFRIGDVVAAGDVVVAGRLEIGSAEEGNLSHGYVRADAEIWGRVYYRLNFEIPFNYFEKTFTGRRSWGYSVGGWRFPLNFGTNDEFIHFETIERRRQASLGQNYPLPLTLTTTTTYELTRHLRTRSLEAAQAMGEEFATRRIQEEFAGRTVDILEKQINFTENENELFVEVFLITIERIDKIQEITNFEEGVDL